MQLEKEQKNKMTFHGKPMQVQPTEFTVMRLQSQAIVSLPFTLRLLVAFQLAMLSGERSVGRCVTSATSSCHGRATPSCLETILSSISRPQKTCPCMAGHEDCFVHHSVTLSLVHGRAHQLQAIRIV